MEQTKYVHRMTLSTERDKKVGFADIVIGNIAIKGITVWRSPSGKLSVFFPSYNVYGRIWDDCVEVPDDIRSEIEAEVIAAYRAEKRENERRTAATPQE